MLSRTGWIKLSIAVGSVLGTLVASGAQGQSHEYIMMMRSSTDSHIFVSESVEGVYGSFRRSSGGEGSAAAIAPSSGERSTWQGYELKTTVGLELRKFLSLSVGHDSVTMRSKDDSQENIRGSKLAGEAKLAFVSPMGNLEFGGAVTGSRYDYQKSALSGGYFGSGYYYLIGWNYFMTNRVSVFGNAKIIQEHLVPNGGDETIPTMDTNMTALGAGFSLWL